MISNLILLSSNTLYSFIFLNLDMFEPYTCIANDVNASAVHGMKILSRIQLLDCPRCWALSFSMYGVMELGFDCATDSAPILSLGFHR